MKRLFRVNKLANEKYRKYTSKKRSRVTLFRQENVKFTTVVIDGKLYEVEWRD